MKRLFSASVIIAYCVITPAYAVDFWHAGVAWAGQGQCSALFWFDSGPMEIRDLQVSVSAVNKNGKEVVSGMLEIPQFGQSSADRYATTALEDIECSDDLIIIVRKATAIIDGKRLDLLKAKELSARNFKPFKIRVDG